MDLTAFFDEFRAEAGEHLRTMDAQLLKLERDPSDPDPIRTMFISAHTIKGGSGMMGLEDARQLAHALEDVLGCLRDQGQPLEAETADLLFRAIDALREMVERSSPDAPVQGIPLSELVTTLRQRATRRPDSDPAAPAPAQSTATRLPVALLVEGSATVRALEKMLLSDAGFEVEALADGREALELALEKPYQLIVAGVELCGLPGLELAASLRESPPCRQLPIVLMSTNEDPEHRRRAAEIGVQAFLRRGSLQDQELVETARSLSPAARTP